MQFIVDELFVGNKLATAEIRAHDGTRVDLRNIRSPIVVFCSKGDNITPPQQALAWILDLYASVDDIRAHGHTIVYAIHEPIVHLGTFVSSSVAKKEHDEFASNIDLIDVLPPGLYEAVMTPKRPDQASVDLIGGDYLVRFETRTLADIRALGGNDAEDDRKFATVARLSEINLGLYRTFLQPWMRICANEGFAKWMRQLHPLRLQYEVFSPANPFMRPLLAYADNVRNNRQAVRQDNPFWQTQEQISQWIETSLDAYRDVRDHMYETLFHAVYGSPVVQAMVGLKASDAQVRKKPGEDAAYRALIARRISELRDGIAEGGPREALLRALIYVRMPDGVVDERGFNFLRGLREEAGKGLSLAEFKKLFREQFLVLLLDEDRAVAAIPDMLARDPVVASRMAEDLHRLIDIVGLHTSLARDRLEEIDELIDAGKQRGHPKPPDRETREHPTARPGREHASTRAKHH